jgi:hypothetical protein
MLRMPAHGLRAEIRTPTKRLEASWGFIATKGVDCIVYEGVRFVKSVWLELSAIRRR